MFAWVSSEFVRPDVGNAGPQDMANGTIKWVPQCQWLAESIFKFRHPIKFNEYEHIRVEMERCNAQNAQK